MGEYNNESITQLKGSERVRKRPEALLGSRGLDGAIHTIQEIIGNSTDERLAGYGDKLDITYYDDGSISIRDYGRGVPLGWNEKEQAWNYNLIYNELYAGGKYDDNQNILREFEEKGNWDEFDFKDYPYLISIGLNGLGGAATQYSSEFFNVTSYKEGKAYTMKFEKGNPILDELIIEDSDEPAGTFIHWKPDNEVFTEIDIPDKWFETTCNALSFISGFDVALNIRGKVKEYKHKTISEVLTDEVGVCTEAKAFKHIVDATNDVCICDVELAIGPNGRGQDYYHNKIAIRGGAHSSGVHFALADFFSDISSEKGIKITDRDYSGKFSVIVSTLANKSSLRNQTKDSIDDGWIATLIEDTIYNCLKMARTKGAKWLEDIIDEVVVNAQNRIAVAEMSRSLREVQRATTRHTASSKFVSCRSYEEKRVAETEFLIVEGDSAGGNVVLARDPDYQCLLKIRGKSLNVFKASLQKLVANKEILDIISVLGCGVDLGIDDFESFSLDKLKVGKIIFCSDADVDGYHIRVLLFLIIYRLFPKLLSNGNVYVADTPLYVINTTSDETIFCMNNEELDAKREEIGSSNIRSIDRFKGLGECDPDVLWETTLCPETRSLRQVKIDPEDTDVHEALEILFGSSTDARKRAILGSMLGTDFDETMESIESLSDYIESLGMNEDLEVEEVEY